MSTSWPRALQHRSPRRCLLPVGCLLAVALSLAGCRTTEPVLLPAPGTGVGPRATVEMQGVRIQAQGSAWTGAPGVSDAVTPIRVAIENRREEALLVRSGDAMLRDAAGNEYAALPLFAFAEGENGALLPDRAATPVVSPLFHHNSGFRVPQVVAALYPSLPTTANAHAVDWAHHARHGTALRAFGLPTSDMLRLGLPEGMFAPGGQASGFVYFEKLGSAVGRVTLHVTVRRATDGEPLGTATIPFAFTRRR